MPRRSASPDAQRHDRPRATCFTLGSPRSPRWLEPAPVDAVSISAARRQVSRPCCRLQTRPGSHVIGGRGGHHELRHTTSPSTSPATVARGSVRCDISLHETPSDVRCLGAAGHRRDPGVSRRRVQGRRRDLHPPRYRDRCSAIRANAATSSVSPRAAGSTPAARSTRLGRRCRTGPAGQRRAQHLAALARRPRSTTAKTSCRLRPQAATAAARRQPDQPGVDVGHRPEHRSRHRARPGSAAAYQAALTLGTP